MLNLASAIELMLKQRLIDEHWTLIFADVDKADKKAFEQGDFKSVDFGDCLDRLNKICGVFVKKDHVNVLSRLRTQRNRIQHFHVSTTKNEAVGVLVAAWSFVFEFFETEITLPERCIPAFDEIKRKVVVHQEFIGHRMSEISVDVRKAETDGAVVIECPVCLQEALPVFGEDTKCLFCMSSFKNDGLIETWQRVFEQGYFASPKDQMVDPIRFECPECADESLCKRPLTGWVCFADNVKKAQRDLKESVWRTYKTLMVLGKDNIRTLFLVFFGTSIVDLAACSGVPDHAVL